MFSLSAPQSSSCITPCRSLHNNLSLLLLLPEQLLLHFPILLFFLLLPPLEFGVYKPSSPDKVFVIDQCSNKVKEEEFTLEEDQADPEERGEIETVILPLGIFRIHS